MTSLIIKPDPKFDLVIDREIDVPVDLVWKAWTTPEHLKHWFVPKPWTITSVTIDLRPGGAFSSIMRSPEGDEFPNNGCVLDVVPQQRLVFTDTLLPGFRPAPNPFFTAVVDLVAKGERTHYTATAIHGTEEQRKKHEDMGFHGGWGTVLTQMVGYIKAGFKPVA